MRNWIKRLKENDMFAWGDLVILGALLVLSFLPLLIFTNQQNAQNTEVVSGASETPTLTAVISHDGKTLKKFNLTKHTGTTTWTYKNKDGDENIVEVKGHKIRVKYANCPDQIDVKMGYKSKAGQTIVCLPHKFLIEIKSDRQNSNDSELVNP